MFNSICSVAITVSKDGDKCVQVLMEQGAVYVYGTHDAIRAFGESIIDAANRDEFPAAEDRRRLADAQALAAVERLATVSNRDGLLELRDRIVDQLARTAPTFSNSLGL